MVRVFVCCVCCVCARMHIHPVLVCAACMGGGKPRMHERLCYMRMSLRAPCVCAGHLLPRMHGVRGLEVHQRVRQVPEVQGGQVHPRAGMPCGL